MLRLVRLLSLTVMLFAGTSAHALVNLGDITGDPPFHKIAFLTASDFTETFTFSLSSASALFANAVGFNIDDFTFTPSFTPDSSTNFPTSLDVSSSSYLALLGPGSYSFSLSGSVVDPGGKYSVSIGSIPAVPEPAEWMLFASGLAVVALIARRRKLGE